MRAMVEVTDFQEAVRLAADKTVTYRFGGDVVVRTSRVTFSGSTACVAYQWVDADGRRWENGVSQGARYVDYVLNFPALPTTGKLTRNEADAWTGYMIHEIGGHVLYTDCAAWDVAVKDGAAVRNILNGLEDVRIEGRVMTDGVFPGAARCLTRLVSRLVHKAWTGGTYKPGDLIQLPFTLAIMGRWKNNGLDIAHMQDIWDSMTALQQAWVDRVLGKLSNCRDTWETLELAREIVAELRDAVRDVQDIGAGQSMPQPGGQPEQGQQDTHDQDQDQGGERRVASGEDWTKDLEDRDEDTQPEPQRAPRQPREPDPMGLPEVNEDEDLDTQEDGDAASDTGADMDEDASDTAEGADAAEDMDQDGGDTKGSGECADDAAEGDDTADAGEPVDSDTNAGASPQNNDGSTWDSLKGENDLDNMVNPEPDVADMAKDVVSREDPDQTLEHGYTFGGYRAVRISDLPEDADAKQIKSRGRWFRDKSKEVKRGGAKLRQQVRQLLTAPEWVGSSRFETKGRLRGRDLTRAAIGDTNVFSRRWEADGIDTAVSLLIDGSGSMSGSSIKLATELAVLFSDILDQARVPFEVAAFVDGMAPAEVTAGQVQGGVAIGSDEALHHTTRNRWGDRDHRVPGSAGYYGFRNEGQTCKLLLIKEMGETLTHAMAAYTRMSKIPTGYTPDYAGLMAAIGRMHRVKASRRIIFCLVDGGGAGAQAIQSACAFAKRRGIDVIGLGMGFKVDKQYPLSLTVHNMAALKQSGLGLLVQQLQGYHAARKAEIMAHQ